MITLTLLHPVQSTPVQSWSFEQDPAIRIGRAVDNHVVLYSAVVSRYHVEIRLTDNQWEVVNLGTNGTYLDGKRVHQAPLTNGSIMRLARSGPNIQITINGAQGLSAQRKGQPERLGKPVEVSENGSAEQTSLVSSGSITPQEQAEAGVIAAKTTRSPFYVSGRYPLFSEGTVDPQEPLTPCDHQSAPVGSLICTHCGFPIHPLQTIGAYQVLKNLNPQGTALMSWRKGHTVVLYTLTPEDLEKSEQVQRFENQAQRLCDLEHPGMPKFFEAFEEQGQPYLVGEMIYGSTLQTWVQERGPVQPYQAVQWSLELGRLLDFLHGQTPPYIHQNIQPATLMRPRISHGFSQVVLVGFGSTGEPTAVLDENKGYRSPEAEGQAESPLTDLYALGMTLVYLLTGQEPDTFYRLEDRNLRLALESAPNVSPELATIIQTLTHPDRTQRFQSAAALVEALQPLL